MVVTSMDFPTPNMGYAAGAPTGGNHENYDGGNTWVRVLQSTGYRLRSLSFVDENTDGVLDVRIIVKL